jgi:hypothetical protein
MIVFINVWFKNEKVNFILNLFIINLIWTIILIL